MGSFLNEFAANVLLAIAVFAALGLPAFGYFYNRLMDVLHGRSEHTSLYVAIGEFGVIVVVALFSWKAALLCLICNGLAGIFMIVGEFQRTEKKKQARGVRRKRMPYAANGRIDDAKMCADEAVRLLGMVLKEKDPTVRALQLATASHELHNVSKNLLELKLIQQIEE